MRSVDKKRDTSRNKNSPKQAMLIPDDFFTVLIRVGVAAILGGLLGLERNIHGRPAGLRTHLLVSLGSATFTVLSIRIAMVAQGSDFFNADPARISAQIVTGIGFLGAGVIIKDGVNVRGLTTAASLWVAAGIGMSAGAGQLILAISITLISIGSLLFFQRIERLYRKDAYRILSMITKNGVKPSEIVNCIQDKNLEVLHYQLRRNYETQETKIDFSLGLFMKEDSEEYFERCVTALEKAELPIKEIHWKKM